jgi:tRNA(Leu) C34 or U34 (ribose-2'-O)-methylase TrmL
MHKALLTIYTYITPGMELRKTKFSYQAEIHWQQDHCQGKESAGIQSNEACADEDRTETTVKLAQPRKTQAYQYSYILICGTETWALGKHTSDSYKQDYNIYIPY